MTGNKGTARNAAEYDLVYAKRIHCYLNRGNASRKIKQGMRRRARRWAKIETAVGE